MATGDVSLSTTGNWADDDQGEAALLAIVEGSAGDDAQASLTFDADTGEAEITGTYGTLYIEADGSYRYELDDTDADTQALDNGDAVSDVFNLSLIHI